MSTFKPDEFEHIAKKAGMEPKLIQDILEVKLNDITYLTCGTGANELMPARVAHIFVDEDILTAEKVVFAHDEWSDFSTAMSTPSNVFKDWLKCYGIFPRGEDWQITDDAAITLAYGALSMMVKRVYVKARVRFEKGDEAEADDETPLSKAEELTLQQLWESNRGRKEMSAYIMHLGPLGTLRRATVNYWKHYPLYKVDSQTSPPPKEETVIDSNGIRKRDATSSERKYVNDLFEIVRKVDIYITSIDYVCIDLKGNDGMPVMNADIANKYIRMIQDGSKRYKGAGLAHYLAVKEDACRQSIVDLKNGHKMGIGECIEAAIKEHQGIILAGPTAAEIATNEARLQPKHQKGSPKGGGKPSQKGGGKGGRNGKGNQINYKIASQVQPPWKSTNNIPFCRQFNEGTGCNGTTCKFEHKCDVMVQKNGNTEPCHCDHARHEHLSWGWACA